MISRSIFPRVHQVRAIRILLIRRVDYLIPYSVVVIDLGFCFQSDYGVTV